MGHIKWLILYALEKVQFMLLVVSYKLDKKISAKNISKAKTPFFTP